MSWEGHIITSKHADDDLNLLLGEADWKENVEFITVDENLWSISESHGLWDEINERCDILVDQFEEEWVRADRLNDLVQLIQGKLGQEDFNSSAYRAFLSALASLAAFAKNNGSSLVFAF